MRVKDVNGKCVVLKRYWLQYGILAYVERVCDTMEEAKMVKESLERQDRLEFIIVNGQKGGI